MKYIGAVLSDEQTVIYPRILSKEEAWDYINKNYPGKVIKKHLLPTPARMPEVIDLSEIKNFIQNLGD